MKNLFFPRFLLFFSSFFLFPVSLAISNSLLRLVDEVPLNGGLSRFSYQAFNPDTHLLYIAHKGSGQIIVFNVQSGKVTNTVSGFPGVTGLCVLPSMHRLYASVSSRHLVESLSSDDLRVQARISAGHYPDCIAYVPDLRQLYVSDEIGGEETVIDVLKNKKIASIKLGGEAGNVRYDQDLHKIFVTCQTRNELVQIDPQTQKIEKRYAVKSGKRPRGLWIDPVSKLAFLGCGGNSKLVVMDLESFQEVGISSVGKDPDMMAFDPSLGLLYVASESGLLSVFRVRARKVEKMGDFTVGEKAHSLELDPETHLLYFPVLEMGKTPVLRIMKPEF